MNSKKILSSVPRESILSALLNDGTLHVLTAGLIPGNAGYELIWEALQLYRLGADEAFRFYLLSDGSPAAEQREATAAHGLTDKIEFVSAEDGATVLSYFLGCDALLSFSRNGEAAALAEELHLPVICPCLTEGVSFRDGQLLVGRSPADLASAFCVLREGKFRELLTRRNSLLKDR